MSNTLEIRWQSEIDSQGDQTLKFKNHAILGCRFPAIFPQLVLPEDVVVERKYFGDLTSRFPIQQIDGRTWEYHFYSRNDLSFNIHICIAAVNQMIGLAKHGLIVGDRNAKNMMLEKSATGDISYGNVRFRLVQVDLAHAFDVQTGKWELNDDKWYPDIVIGFEGFSGLAKQMFFDEIVTILKSLRRYFSLLPERDRPQKYDEITRQIDLWIKYGQAYFYDNPAYIDEISAQLNLFAQRV